MAIDTYLKAVRARNAMARSSYELTRNLAKISVLFSQFCQAVFGAYIYPIIDYRWLKKTKRLIVSRWSEITLHQKTIEIEGMRDAAQRLNEIANELEFGIMNEVKK